MTRLASSVLLPRGFLVLMLASIAVRWPEDALQSAMVAAGGVMFAASAIELATSRIGRGSRRVRGIVAVDALLSLSFGLVALSVPLLAVPVVATVFTLWLLAHAILALWLAPRVARIPHARAALLTWSAVDLLCAFATAVYSRDTAIPLMYYGAAYAWWYAMAQIAAGVWLRRHDGSFLTAHASSARHPLVP